MKDLFERSRVRFLREYRKKVSDFLQSTLEKYMRHGNLEEILQQTSDYIKLIESSSKAQSTDYEMLVIEMSRMQ